MRPGWIFFISRRYFKTKRKEKGMAAAFIATLGIAIGVSAIIIVMAVMNGFQLGFIEDILEISSFHLRLEIQAAEEPIEKYLEKIRDIDQVESVVAFLDRQTIISSTQAKPMGCFLRGVNSDILKKDRGMREHLIMVLPDYIDRLAMEELLADCKNPLDFNLLNKYYTMHLPMEMNKYHLQSVLDDIDDFLLKIFIIQSYPKKSDYRFSLNPGLNTEQKQFLKQIFIDLGFLSHYKLKDKIPESEILRLNQLLSQLNYKNSFGLPNGFHLEDEGQIVLGQELASFLSVEKGDYVSLYALSGKSLGGQQAVNREFQVSGIFRSGYYDFDLGWAFVSLKDFQRYFNTLDSPRYGIKIKNRMQDEQVIAKIKEIIQGKGNVQSWREYNRSFFGALRMEKLIMLLLMALMLFVVAVSIFQSLSRAVMERKDEIAVLRSMGASINSIQLIFLIEGAIIGFLGGIGGLIAGLFLVDKVKLLGLYPSSIFYLDNGVPYRVLFPETLLVFLFAFFSALIAAYFASLKINRLKPAEILRY